MRAILSLIALAFAIAGCGTKGPLVLPKPKPEAQKPAAPPKSVPAEPAEPAEKKPAD